jgi:4-hydroxyphenylacetate 3-monooxygenase
VSAATVNIESGINAGIESGINSGVTAGEAARAPRALDAGSAPRPRHTLRTGASYIAALRDDRTVFYRGDRIRDVTTHPAMRNSVRSIARLYDALHDAELGPTLTCATDDESGAGRTHRFFRVARCREDLVGAQQAIAAWARLTYGWMGRTPDYKASLTNTFGGNADFYGTFAGNARRWYRRAQDELTFISHAIANPPIDRHKDNEDVKDVFVHVKRETAAGIVVSGAKVVATGAALTEYCFIGQTPSTVSDDADMALCFMARIGAPGVKLICRASYEHAATHTSPFDAPLSSRFDENDAIVVFDDVLIPWEDVLVYRDPDKVRALFPESGFLNGFLFQGCTRYAVKLEFIAGLLSKALRATGGIEHRANRALLGEVVAWSHTFWSLSNAMASNPEPWAGGAVIPERRAALAYCVLAPECYPRVKDIIERTVGSALIYLPSSSLDLANPELDATLKQYVRGASDIRGRNPGGVGGTRESIGHRERIKIMKLLWDAIGSEFGGRHELYERNYAGGWESVRLMVQGLAERDAHLPRMERLVDQCLAEYDENGWTGASPWVS